MREMDVKAFQLPYMHPLLCLHLIMGACASYGFSDPFSLQSEKTPPYQQFTLLLEKLEFFLILISEFQSLFA
jgi:hypothetical protein